MKRLILLVGILTLCLAGCASEETILDSPEEFIDITEEIVEVVDEVVEAEKNEVSVEIGYKHFDEETQKEIGNILSVSDIYVTTTVFDEDCGQKPVEVLFFTVDSIGAVSDDTSNLYDRVNAGGCIEAYPSKNMAIDRDEYLLGYYLFGLTGGKHAAVNNYVLQISQELSSEEQENLLAELRVIFMNRDTSVSLDDYLDAVSFEKALNDGHKVNGKTVEFCVNDYKPDSALGINCWAGEHLNFISKTELNVKVGDIIVGRVTEEPTKVLGSWKIPYTVLSINDEAFAQNENQTTSSNNATDNQTDEITLTMSADEFKGMNYQEAEQIFRKMGFGKFDYRTIDTEDETSDNAICYVEITEWFLGEDDFVKGDKFDADATVTFVSYKYVAPAEPIPMYYSTNSLDTVRNGNAGKYAYKNSGKFYDIYWIIDFDEGYVYYFTHENVEEEIGLHDYCDRLLIDSGTLNDTVVITYHDGGVEWKNYLHFKYVNQPDKLIVVDNDDLSWEYTPTDLDKALSLLDTKTITDY